MRVELNGDNLAVMPDSPFLRHYKVDYVNMSRNMSGEVATSTQITSGLLGENSAYDGDVSFISKGGNGSSTKVENLSANHFWESLERGIKNILLETDKVFPEGSAEEFEEVGGAFAQTTLSAERNVFTERNTDERRARNTRGNNARETRAQTTRVARRSTFREAASVIIHRESGVVTVRATGRQHERIQEFIGRVANAARRQVMIEATIVEVALNDGYQQGIE
jgi:general secretion pathway protein D